MTCSRNMRRKFCKRARHRHARWPNFEDRKEEYSAQHMNYWYTLQKNENLLENSRLADYLHRKSVNYEPAQLHKPSAASGLSIDCFQFAQRYQTKIWAVVNIFQRQLLTFTVSVDRGTSTGACWTLNVELAALEILVVCNSQCSIRA